MNYMDVINKHMPDECPSCNHFEFEVDTCGKTLAFKCGKCQWTSVWYVFSGAAPEMVTDDFGEDFEEE